MKHSVVFPLVSHPINAELITPAGAEEIARAAERAGFHAISFTDHPAPSQKWLSAGGHDALDPFVALSFVAAVTTRMLLIPNVVVLPYRNPFIVAKSAATLDALSGGRFVLSVAAGYLRSEYRALGVDFERRNELFDEALQVVRGVWREDEFTLATSGFTAERVSANPKPAHVPIWVGGNTALARRRVARYADGWNPFRAPPELARTARTAAVGSLEELARLIVDLRCRLEREGRDPSRVDVQFSTGLPGPGQRDFSPGAHLDLLADMAAVGVTWNSVGIPGVSVQAAVEALEHYGSEVLAKAG